MNRCRYLLHLAQKSAWNRRGTLLLIVASIALSTTLLLSIEKLRTQLRESFLQSVSGIDLVVGARGSSVQLMLYAVFHLGSAMNNMSLASCEKIAKDPRVAWVIPLSLGDTHRGYPVVATTEAMYTHFHFRQHESLRFAEGHAPTQLLHAVVGAEVAKNCDYALGQQIILSHGSVPGSEHSDSPFTLCGILAPTGTPVDRSIYISLAAMDAIHAPFAEHGHEHEVGHEHAHAHSGQLTAVLVGLHHRSQVFALQRAIQDGREEALMAVLPGVAMNQIWDMVGIGEDVLLCISCMVTIVGLFGLAAAILAGLGERRRELAILRSSGASPRDILLLLTFEGLLLVVSGLCSGIVIVYTLEWLLQPLLADAFGLYLTLALPTAGEWMVLGGICCAGLCSSLLPAIRAYKISLADGLTVAV